MQKLETNFPHLQGVYNVIADTQQSPYDVIKWMLHLKYKEEFGV